MKDEFVLPIDTQLFRSTNMAWNELMLNDPWSIGYVATLIESKNWNSKEEWENFYYRSGEERLSLLHDDAHLLNNFLYVKTHPNEVKNLPYAVKYKNTQFGRTIEELKQRAKVLHSYMINKGSSITEYECFQCVRFRVICETWNGIVFRENNTIATLKKEFPHLSFEKTKGEDDHEFAVDYYVYKGHSLVCGLQIKPISYTRNTPYIEKARNANKLKNATFTKLYGVKVFDVISKMNGEIYNTEVLSRIKELA